MSKSNFKKFLVTLSLLRHRKRHQTNITRFFLFESLSIKIFDYASVVSFHLIVSSASAGLVTTPGTDLLPSPQ